MFPLPLLGCVMRSREGHLRNVDSSGATRRVDVLVVFAHSRVDRAPAFAVTFPTLAEWEAGAYPSALNVATAASTIIDSTKPARLTVRRHFSVLAVHARQPECVPAIGGCSCRADVDGDGWTTTPRGGIRSLREASRPRGDSLSTRAPGIASPTSEGGSDGPGDGGTSVDGGLARCSYARSRSAAGAGSESDLQCRVLLRDRHPRCLLSMSRARASREKACGVR